MIQVSVFIIGKDVNDYPFGRKRKGNDHHIPSFSPIPSLLFSLHLEMKSEMNCMQAELKVGKA